MRLVALAFLLTSPLVAQELGYKDTALLPCGYHVHDPDRPRPVVVDPGPAPAAPTPAPSDAIVLFDGTDLDGWQSGQGPARWEVENGYAQVNGTGNIRTRESFGDCQLHIEWATPAPAKGSSQGRGNSGVFLMGLYEIQVLDSFENATYADGQAAAIYGQTPPLVNACRRPGEWQTYDIVFRAPRFADDGSVRTPARATVLHNGVLVQDDVELLGPTVHRALAHYSRHADAAPIELQDHGNPVRYRNIWLRKLPPRVPVDAPLTGGAKDGAKDGDDAPKEAPPQRARGRRGDE